MDTWLIPDLPEAGDALEDLELVGLFLSDPPPDATSSVMMLLDAELPFGIFRSAAVVIDPQSTANLDELRQNIAATVAEVATGEPAARRRRRKQELVRNEALPEIGATLDGKYRIEELVGAGGFAVVYRATHLLLHMAVAMKLLQPEMIRRQPELSNMLCTEARLAARVNHPNLVRVYDANQTPRLTYVVMEYIDGSTLADTLESKGALPIEFVVRIGLDVVAGLKAALASGLIHRDIKPSNILLTRAGEAKIVDFGLAQLRAESADGTGWSPRALVGTPGYMAPEQTVPGAQIDFHSDMYALGVTLYQAACGRLPFANTDLRRCLWAHRNEPVPPPHEVRPGLPLPLGRLLLWLLSKQPALRPASYDVLTDKLRQVLELRVARHG